MALPVSLNSRVWSAKGIKPAAGDEVYSPGDQPIAPYDNWVMWAVTKDIHNVTDELGDHNDHHEVGGGDELDLHNLSVNDAALLNGDADAGEVRWVDPATNSTVTRIDIDDRRIRQWPTWAIAPRLDAGATLSGGDISDGSGVALYDRAAGATGKFHYAKEADHALTADYADVAGALEDSDGNEWVPADFLLPGDDATITGTWTFANTISGDIDGHAATADSATTADSADTADYATAAGDSDTVDGYEAQELIDQASSTGEWTAVNDWTHSTVGTRFDTGAYQAGTTFDRYRVSIYHESHRTGWPKSYFWFQIGSGGSVDTRSRYKWWKYKPPIDGWTSHYADAWAFAGAEPGAMSVNEYEVFCPQAINAPDDHWPTITSTADGDTHDVPKQLEYGHLETDYPQIDTFRFYSHYDTTTGKIVLEGKNI